MRQITTADAYLVCLLAGAAGLTLGLLLASLGGLPKPTAPESAMLGGLIVFCVTGVVWIIESGAE